MRVCSAVFGALASCLSACASSGRVEHLLSQMTLDEKISLVHGIPEPAETDQGQPGFLPGVPRLKIPSMRFADGPPGVLTRFPASALTATMGLAATFSREDARANGVAIASDARALGIDVVLQPYINIHRDQTFARAYNTYGEDPLLTGMMGASLIRGIQGEGILAQAKHYLAYDGGSDVTVDAQTLHEIYLAPFDAAVAAHVSSIMCSYNVINGAYACGNHELLTNVLREELRFDGFVTSDWGAVHATPFIEAGDDLEMPGNGTVMDSYFEAELPRPGVVRKSLIGPMANPMPEESSIPVQNPITVPVARPIGVLPAINQGLVSEQTVTRAAARILTQMQRFGLLDRKSSSSQPSGVPARTVLANAAIILKTSEDAAVLLKNDSQALPLTGADLSSLALIGPGALQDVAVGESGEKALGHLERQIGPAAALEAIGAHVEEAVADDMTGTAVPAAMLESTSGTGLERRDAHGAVIAHDTQLDFTVAGGNPLPAGSEVSWSGVLRIPHTARYRLYLQILGASATMRIDGEHRTFTGPLQLHGNVLQPGQDNVLPTRDGLDNVRREILLSEGTHSLSINLKGDTFGQPVQIRLAWVPPEQRASDYQQAIDAAKRAKKAIVFAWSRGRPSFQLPGEQDQLIADVAAVNPNTVVVLNISEPIAMPWLDKVKAVLLMWYPGDEGGPATANVLSGHFNPAGRLPFTWPVALSDNVANDPTHPERSSAGIKGKTSYSEGLFIGYRWFDQQRIEPLFPFGYGLSYSQFDYSALSIKSAADGGLDVGVQLRNAGSAAGDEVAQVYLAAPSSAPEGAQFASRALAGFERVHLAAGESRRVSLHVMPRSLQYWSVAQGSWKTAPGPREIEVGASERDIRLKATTSIRPP